MASAVKEETKFQECGLCFENDELKRLSCNPEHIYCTTCLTKDLKDTKIIKCPLCRIVFDEGIDDIPSAGAPLDKLLCCDVCMRKDDKRKYAQIYCVICQKKFCKPHMDAHNFALDDHKRITMDEYKKEYRKVEIRRCETHTDQAYSVACMKCNKVFCATCVAVNPGTCTDGSSHNFTELQILVDDFIKLINDMKLWIFDKEECLLGLVKQITRILSDWDGDTEEMITKLRTLRDMQIEKLTEKYELLEKRIQKLREQSKNEVTSFLDEDIGTKLDKISRGVKKIDTRIFTYHQVDIVKGLKDTEYLTRELLNLELPQYKPSESHIKLIEKESTDVILDQALEIRADKGFSLVMPEITQRPLSILSPLHTQVNPPSSLKLLRQCRVSVFQTSVFHHLRYTYVGCVESVDRVSQDGEAREQFVTLGYRNLVRRIAVKANQLYFLIFLPGGGYKIQAHDLSGALVRHWTTDVLGNQYAEFALARNSIVLPDSKRKHFTLYSFTGNLIKHIPCDLLTGKFICVTALEDNSVFVTVRDSSTVFRINVDSGKVMWTSRHVKRPQGVVCYKDRYLLVTNKMAKTRIWMLDIITGECVGELTGHQEEADTHIDISGDTLIISWSGSFPDWPKMIQYYDIE